MTRLLATGASLVPSFPQTLEGEGYSANLRQRMVPRYRRASTFGTAANALDDSATPQFSKMRSGVIATQSMRVLGSPSRESKESKSGTDAQPNPLRDGEIGGSRKTRKRAKDRAPLLSARSSPRDFVVHGQGMGRHFLSLRHEVARFPSAWFRCL